MYAPRHHLTWGRTDGSFARQLRRRATALRHTDWVLTAAALALTVLGGALIYSARGAGTAAAGGTDAGAYLLRQMLSAGVGIVLMAGLALYGLHRIAPLAPVLYGVGVLLVALVLTPLGNTANGAQRWLDLGGVVLQPTEFLKVAVVLCVAMVLTENRTLDEPVPPTARRVLAALGLVAVPGLLILLTPDLGQTLGMGVIVLAMLFAAGADRRWFAGLSALVVVACVAVWQLDLLDGYQMDRFVAFLDPGRDPSGVGYNTEQARIAIGSGGLTGYGLLNGPQNAGHFVPEQHTDFVFSVAGEEWGFLGAGAVIGLIGVVLWRTLRIARRSSDAFGTVVAVGVCAWLAFQAFQNIGMNLGIMPVTGLPLTFVSYGGSSMIAGWAAIGLLQAVHRRTCAPVSSATEHL